MSSNPRKANIRPIDTDRVSPLEALRMATGEANAHRATELPLDQIKVDQSVQVRVEGLHEETVLAYTAVLENGGELDPVTVIRDEYGDYELADGFHRYEAHVRASKLAIMAYVRDGGHDAALDEAEEGNLKHGRPLTNEDKKNILRRRMKRGHAWATLSTRDLGKLLGVGHNTVKRWIDEFQATVPNGTVDRSQIVGADGRVINTGNIGKTPKSTSAPVLEWENVPGLEAPEGHGGNPEYVNWTTSKYEMAERGQKITLPEGWRVVRVRDQVQILNAEGKMLPRYAKPFPVEDLASRSTLPPGYSMGKLDKGEDADGVAPVDDVTAMKQRESSVAIPLTDLGDAISRLNRVHNIEILRDMDWRDRLWLMREMGSTIERITGFAEQLYDSFTAEQVAMFFDFYSNAYVRLQSLGDKMADLGSGVQDGR